MEQDMSWPSCQPGRGGERTSMSEGIGESGWAASQAANAFDARLGWRATGLVAADLLLICTGAAAPVDPFALLFAHVALVSTCAALLAPGQRCDRTPWTLSVLLVLVAGPLGGAAILLLGLSARRGLTDVDVVEAWYDWLSGDERPDPTRSLYEAILAGRAFRPASQGRRSFADIVAHGSLAEKQALLGHIGLKYHQDYSPLIAMALRSPQSPVRAQAAAVFVKLREQVRQRLHAGREGGRAARNRGDVPVVLACAQSILDCAESGFLDASEVREALAEAKALATGVASSPTTAGEQATVLSRIVAAGVEDDGLLELLVSAPPAGAHMRRLLANCLVAKGRHMELHKLLFGAEQTFVGQALVVPLAPEGRR